MSTDFTVTITNPQRAADWQEILGTTTVAVKSPIPQLANLPGHPRAQIYMLDLDILTAEQVDRLVAHIAQRFSIPTLEVKRDIKTQGVPILAEDCIVTVSNPQRWLH